jgi:hypothetical protein
LIEIANGDHNPSFTGGAIRGAGCDRQRWAPDLILEIMRIGNIERDPERPLNAAMNKLVADED